MGEWYTKIWFIKGVDNVNWPPYRDWKADVSSVSPSSERTDELWANVIYCITCTKLYIGETGRRLGDRFRKNTSFCKNTIRELKQPRRQRQQKPQQICIFDNEKQHFCTLCTCIFQLLTFWRRSRSFYDVKWPVLQLCGRREHIICLLYTSDAADE